MTGKRVRLALGFLITLLLAYIALQSFFVVKSYSLEKKNFYIVVRNLVGTAFFETNIDSMKLNKLAKSMKDEGGLAETDMKSLGKKLKLALKEYGDLPERLKNRLLKEGIDAEFSYRLWIEDFAVLENGRKLFSLPDKLPEGITLMGSKDFKKTDTFATSFHLRNRNNYTRVSFEVGFPGIVGYVLGNIGELLIFSLIAVIVIGAILLYTALTLLKQEELSRMKSDFIDNITHELNTPIATIGMAVSNMELVSGNQSKMREITDVIKRQNIKLRELVGGIMRVSFMGAGVELKKQNLKVTELIDSAVQDFCFKNPSVTVEAEYSEHIPQIEGDRFLILTALTNLLDNGVKYSGDNCVIKLKAVSLENRVRISVSDEGIGIDRKDQKKIFNKFYRVSRGNIHKVKGLGIGLYTVRKIVNAHDGSVEVISKPGEGSCFTISLRAGEEHYV